MSSQVEATPVNVIERNRILPARDRLIGWLVTPISVAVVLVVWQYGLKYFDVPQFLVPPPTAIWSKLVSDTQNGVLVHHTIVTAKEIVFGYVAGSSLGIVLGVLIGLSRVLERIIYPFVIALNSVPKVAIAPLVVVWFGVGLTSKVIIAAMVSFFPLLVNVIVGLRSTESEQLRLMRSLTASPWQTFYMLQLRNALPMIFAGLEVAIILSVIGAIVAEFVAAQEGLGYYIQEMNAMVNTPAMFAALIILAVMGWVLSAIVKFVARKVVFWKEQDVLVEAP